MTNYTIPEPGDLRVGVFASPSHLITTTVRDAKEAEDMRQFSTATSVLSRQHGEGGTFPSDAFIQRFNGRTWETVDATTEYRPWRVVTLDHVFRFGDEESARRFATNADIVEYAPDVALIRT